MQLTQPRLQLPGFPFSALGFYGADLPLPFAFALPLALAFAKAASFSAFAAREGFLGFPRSLCPDGAFGRIGLAGANASINVQKKGWDLWNLKYVVSTQNSSTLVTNRGHQISKSFCYYFSGNRMNSQGIRSPGMAAVRFLQKLIPSTK